MHMKNHRPEMRRDTFSQRQRYVHLEPQFLVRWARTDTHENPDELPESD